MAFCNDLYTRYMLAFVYRITLNMLFLDITPVQARTYKWHSYSDKVWIMFLSQITWFVSFHFMYIF